MNTKDLAREVKKTLPEVTIQNAKDVLDRAFDIIPEIAITEPVRVAGFGEFHIIQTKAKKVKVFGGEVKEVPSRMKLKFRAFKKP